MKLHFSISLKLTLIVVAVSAAVIFSLTIYNINEQAISFDNIYVDKAKDTGRLFDIVFSSGDDQQRINELLHQINESDEIQQIDVYYKSGNVIQKTFSTNNNSIFDQYETYINAVAFAVGLLTFIIWAKISIKRGPKLVYIASGAMFFISLLPLAFAKEGWGWVVLILMVFVGFSISGLLLIPDILLAEIIDEDVKKSGEKREGLIYGIYGFAIRIAIVFESYLITFVLNRTKFDPLASEQSPLAKTGIKVLMVGVPAICFIIGILLMIFYYDLSRKKIEKKYNRKFSIFH